MGWGGGVGRKTLLKMFLPGNNMLKILGSFQADPLAGQLGQVHLHALHEVHREVEALKGYCRSTALKGYFRTVVLPDLVLPFIVFMVMVLLVAGLLVRKHQLLCCHPWLS